MRRRSWLEAKTLRLCPMLGLLLAGAAFPRPAPAALVQNSVVVAATTKLTGIGAVLHTDNGYATVTQIVPGGPADRDGQLKVNDRVIAVAQPGGDFVSCANLALDKVVAMIRGGKGTKVRLQVLSGGALQNAQPKVISLVRDEINMLGGVPIAKPAPTPSITADQQKKLDAVIAKVSGLRRKRLITGLRQQIDDLVKAAGLDETHRKILDDGSAKAVDQTLKELAPKLDEYFKNEIRMLPAFQLDGALSQLASLSDVQLGMYATVAQAQAPPPPPTDQPAWTDALKKALTPAQAATWTALEAKREQAIQPEIADYLKTVARRANDMEVRQLEALSGQVQASLNLPQNRVDKLNALVKSIASKYGDEAAAAARKTMMAMDEDGRKQMIKNQEFSSPAVSTTAWTDGLAKILTPDETQRLQTSQADREDRQVRALTKVFLSLMDERIAFTAAQRAKLEPLARRAIKETPNLMAGFNQQQADYFSIPLTTFYSAAQAADQDQVHAILDASQWRHWDDAANQRGFTDQNGYQEATVSLPDVTEAAKPAPPAEPEDVETAISDYLAQKARDEEKTILEGSLLRAEDIARVTQLSDAASQRLQTAARAAAEHFMTQWKVMAESNIRANLSDATPDTVRQRLSSIQCYYISNQPYSDEAVTGVVWDSTIHSALSPAQQQGWAKETAARVAYRNDAIASLITSTFGATTGLSSGQMDRLEPLVRKVLDDYADDFPGTEFWGGTAWYLQSFNEFMPIQGIAEADLNAIMSKEQIGHWKGTQGYSYTLNWWQNIKQNHQQRAGNRGKTN